jgi:hypothetical protein
VSTIIQEDIVRKLGEINILDRITLGVVTRYLLNAL